MTDHSTQRERIMDLLLSKPSVPLPEILDLRIANYRARISELRELGHDIRCETQWLDGMRRSRYLLMRVLPLGEQASLFAERV